MTCFLLIIGALLVGGGAGWYFGWRQGHRGLPLVSSKPTL